MTIYQFGKVGMRHFHLTRNSHWNPIINLDKLWTLLPQETRDEYISGSKKDTAPVFDLLPLGYSKLLGKGRIPEIPIVVRARYVSAEAERKIKEAGGTSNPKTTLHNRIHRSNKVYRCHRVGRINENEERGTRSFSRSKDGSKYFMH